MSKTMNCTIVEHTAEGKSVGTCHHALTDDVCPRHGYVKDYPNNDDRDVQHWNRDFRGVDFGPAAA